MKGEMKGREIFLTLCLGDGVGMSLTSIEDTLLSDSPLFPLY